MTTYDNFQESILGLAEFETCKYSYLLITLFYLELQFCT